MGKCGGMPNMAGTFLIRHLPNVERGWLGGGASWVGCELCSKGRVLRSLRKQLQLTDEKSATQLS